MKATICDIIHLTNVGSATRIPTKSSPPVNNTRNWINSFSVAAQPQLHFHPQLHRIATQNPH